MTHAAGKHLILDLFGAHNLSDFTIVTTALLDAAKAIGATVLDVQTHYFEPQGGVTGVALLAESHISIHTWPEDKFAAIDIFVCGELDPHKAIDGIKLAFTPDDIQIVEIQRGMS